MNPSLKLSIKHDKTEMTGKVFQRKIILGLFNSIL